MDRSFQWLKIFVLQVSIVLLLVSGVSAQPTASARMEEQPLGAALPASSGEVAALDAPQLIDQPTHRDIFPWTAVDSKNITHIVFTASDRGLWYDNDADGSFGHHPQRLEAALGANREPFETLAVGPDDTIHLVYTLLDRDQQVYYRQGHLVGNTAVWSPRQLISSGFKALSATLTVDAQNNAHLVWIEKRCGIYNVYYRVRYANGTFSNTDAPKPDCVFQNRPQVTVSTDGVVHMIYQHDTEVFYARNDGSGWTNQNLSRTPKLASLNPTITTAGQAIYVAWDEGVNSHDVLFRYSLNSGRSWSKIIPIAVSSAFSSFPNILYKPSTQRVHIVWSDSAGGVDGQPEIWYREFNPQNVTLTPSKRLTFTPGSSTLPVMAIGPGKISIVWQDKRSGTWELYHISGWIGERPSGA